MRETYNRIAQVRNPERVRNEWSGTMHNVQPIAHLPVADKGEQNLRVSDSNTAARTPSFALPGLVLLGPGNALIACNNEAVRILSFPNPSIHAKKVNTLIVEKLRLGNSSGLSADTERQAMEIVSGRRRYLCSHYVLDMQGPQPLRTTAILMDRVGNAEVTMHELCSRFHLTAREREAVGYLVKGMTSKEIAQAMGISPNTVKSFLRLVMTKAGVSTRAGLIGKVAGISMQPTLAQKVEKYFGR